MPVPIGVVVFPGSNCDRDTLHGLELAGAEPVVLWHEQATLDGVAAVILPGGFAYGDYLRAGVIARFSPVMRAVEAFAADGGLVLGICNGFQVLAEAGLVPGALLRNRGLRFLGRDVRIAAERLDTPFTHALAAAGRPLRMPIAHGEGRVIGVVAALAVGDRHPERPSRCRQRMGERRIEPLRCDPDVTTQEPQPAVPQERSRHEPGLGEDLELSLIHI